MRKLDNFFNLARINRNKIGKGRAPAQEPFPFQQILPLQLKETVSGKGEKTSEVACLQEMAVLLACFKKNEYNQVVCSKEIQSFGKCFKEFEQRKKLKKEQDAKGILVPGAKKLTHKQVNSMLRKYPPV